MYLFTPNIRHLRAIQAVSLCNSITQASKIIHLSQPAITQAIAKMEKLLGISIFERSNKGVYETEAGSIFLRRVERALELIKEGAFKAIYIGTNKKVRAQSDISISVVQLKALIAVEKSRNYTLAARELCVSQPAVYRAAKDLERVVGTKLYLTSKDGIELTHAASCLVKFAKLAFSELNQAFIEIESWHGRDSGFINIGTMPLAKTNLLPKAITTFSQQCPNVKIQIEDGSYKDLLYGLRHGNIDFLIGALRYPTPIDDILQEPLFEDELAIVVRSNHPLTQKLSISMKDLASFPWIVPREGAPTRDYFNTMLDRNFIEISHQLVETSSLALIRNLLHESNRITILSKHQVQFEVELNLLTMLPINLPNTERTIGITFRDSWSPTKTQQIFLQIIRELEQ